MPKNIMAKSIGTRFESSLHRDLKFRYAGQDGKTESEVGGFVADGVNAKGEFIEVQTGSFGPLKKKVQSLVLLGNVRIIHPIIVNKYIEVFDTNGKLKYRRKSPRKGNLWDFFDVLIYAPELPLIRGLVIELVLIDAVETRISDGKGSWRRKGISIKDRKMVSFHEKIIFKKLSDYLRFVPFKKSEEFTTQLLSKETGITIDIARKVLYTLTKMGVVERVGKQRNALVYRLPQAKKLKKNK
jgi:ribosomal protein S25